MCIIFVPIAMSTIYDSTQARATWPRNMTQAFDNHPSSAEWSSTTLATLHIKAAAPSTQQYLQDSFSQTLARAACLQRLGSPCMTMSQDQHRDINSSYPM